MSDFKAKPAIKRLYATLIKMKIAQFLISENFRLLLMEWNADEVWNAFDKQVRSESNVAILISGYTGYATDTLIRFLDYLYTTDNASFLLAFLDAAILKHFQESNSNKEIDELKERLKEMKLFSKSKIDTMAVFKFKPVSVVRGPRLSKDEKADNKTSNNTDSKKVFVVHGRDDTAKKELADILKDELQLEPIVLMDQPNRGKTVIEKFEDHTLKIGYAFVILTPDDVGCLQEDFDKHRANTTKAVSELKPRARENVILELGYFVGKLGRERVCCIHKGSQNLLPSDLHGLITIRYSESVKEKFLDIKKELKQAGYVK